MNYSNRLRDFIITGHMKGTFGFQVKFSRVIILTFLEFNNLFNSVVSRASKQLWIFGQNEKRWYEQQIKSVVHVIS